MGVSMSFPTYPLSPIQLVGSSVTRASDSLMRCVSCRLPSIASEIHARRPESVQATWTFIPVVLCLPEYRPGHDAQDQRLEQSQDRRPEIFLFVHCRLLGQCTQVCDLVPGEAGGMIHVRRSVSLRSECGNPILEVNGPSFISTRRCHREMAALNKAPSTAWSEAMRSGTWSGASQCLHHARMSSTDGGCRPCSILLTFEKCQPATCASTRPVKPASVRISRRRVPSASLASCAADDGERNTAVISVGKLHDRRRTPTRRQTH